MTALSALQAVLIAAPSIGLVVTFWCWAEERSKRRVAEWGYRMLHDALAQADVDAQARGY